MPDIDADCFVPAVLYRIDADYSVPAVLCRINPDSSVPAVLYRIDADYSVPAVLCRILIPIPLCRLFCADIYTGYSTTNALMSGGNSA